MELVIKNGLVYTGGRFAERQVYIKDGVIAQVAPRAEAPAGCPELDLGGKRLAPGFIDVHTHGGAGVDVNAATAERHHWPFFCQPGHHRLACQRADRHARANLVVHRADQGRHG